MVMESSGEALTERDRQREETRRRVRAVVLDAIRKDGLEGARVDEIARSAGVSRGTVYFHYPTKEHVVAEVLAETEGRIAEALDALPESAPVKKVLETFCASYGREWGSEAALFPAVAAVALRQAAASLLDPKIGAVRQALARAFHRAEGRGELTSAMRPAVLADLFLFNALAATLAWTSRPRARLAAALGNVTTIFLEGARAARR